MHLRPLFLSLACALAGCGAPPEDGPPDAGAETRSSGFVDITSGAFGGMLDHPVARAAAGFFVASSPATCETRTVGMCAARNCTTTAASRIASASAGTITITGGKQAVTLTPDGKGAYAAFSDQATLWSGGETIDVSAAGADVPAFEGTLVAPAQVTVTAPAFDSALPLAIDRGHDLALAWSGGSGTVGVTLVGPSSDATTASLSCSFDATDRTGTVPAVLLQALPAGTGSFAVAVGDVRVVTAGVFSVHLDAATYALTPGGAPVAGDALLR